MSEVILKQITKSYKEKEVIHGIDLHIREGEFLTLLGPSGCGKTTILNMIAGLESISSGEIHIGGRLMNDVPARKRNIGMVFQSYALFPHMTVDQNIAFGLKIQKLPRIQIFEKLEWAKELLHLSEKGKSFPRELSGGERQRVALGRALVLQPHVLLLDEPLSNLDQELRESMTTELKRIHQNVGCTSVYVTHNQMEALRMSDRIAVIRDGRLIQCDTPMRIFERPTTVFVGNFIGSPAMNQFPARIAEAGGEAVVTIGDTALCMEKGRSQALLRHTGREVLAGIRPQQINFFKDREGMRHSDTDVRVEVQIYEPLGERLMVTGKFNSHDMVFFMIPDPEHLPKRGDALQVVIDGRHIHFFDRETGVRITDGE
ncbi:MAG: hypothetical protein A2487_06145 [Candidatus Raymondbacteria bacterium RifOxyC12_full_50_8]|uniref:ABC transporter domain-containing protein n=1 Tax=Candidatus Raymondbacteria bacterium RIFOXYD12_FULL_49_13 TaxID=1817890 RepID=A0A1F7F9I7_UNCRA|nr:MAG: hypothetical protein A2248_18600 [Candidatus Raymondbacteria bacterium RIFOXYA2_FULL_49_16]OGJ98599.1 MAG: hypothetical protein A2350_14185 [Candidatus Raymondbacteria bacterium RifOxyB12_full_50_8]OGJ99483.1 MAG: hypothetical protein A2487_06145 [Candidatus Raymondbacteria bacterium RifOxyC12_full_50_8]OGK03271.1 MAG: hypothetical protein A2519_13165 [Candidatus Raymondbacteria bacterium RIFOXYD12_FULL_49_13]OGP41544.1 MAG: hypothetical protein A2324_09685 [Candidatus Raymondbacteria b